MRHLYLHHDGYPTGAAWRFAEALCEAPEPASFFVAFLITQPNAVRIQSPEQAADAEYSYRVQLVPDAESHLQVQCWRRIPGSDSWNPRCGPMPMAVFIQRFLPGDASQLTAAVLPDGYSETAPARG
ncbi:hypothetical protein [Synechococcus sp. BA-132 BA5]|uniref:hypothetical protein n=1 Tax=Synechococcus sp. BA-132 BA5 TaxID=3110252 RepID=UPI002B1F8ED4|nr:hypothetical protein [Synechococcus sp. BA-132 BA5]MEA5414568.1 hypothetical protein [Synechococcus sp. BA-132 BA5]